MAAPTSEQEPATILLRINALVNRFMSRISVQEEPTDHDVQTQPKTPWDSWELDGNFFGALSRWTLDHPETTLDRVLDNIRNGLENSKDLLSLIPDNPFPARGLVTSLAYLIKLGISIRRAQREVYDFVKDVTRWVGLVKSAFESTEDGQFARRTWRDLEHMRDLVVKICLWAVERLNDGGWLRIGHGLTISKEIQEFNERMANARALFQDLSAINMSRGLDAIMKKLRSLIQSHQAIGHEIQEIRKTQQKQLDRIANELELQTQVAERESFFANTLDLHAITSFAYDNQGKRPCDEDTRIGVLEDIRDWRYNIKHGSPNFLWLTGDPGCGKSAVTASFARECKDEGVLWAQFFINRNNAETTDPRSYFPSIARQLADYSPEVAKDIHLTLGKQRSLADDISAEQAARLFTDAIQKASALDPDRPVVVVIDGLDETDHDRLEDTAAIFSTLFTVLGGNSNVKVFISSRTENEIQKSFTLPLNNNHIKHIHLDTTDSSSIRDVSHYIRRNLLDLVRQHDLNWDVWPGEERSQALGDRASGLFIWGVTAIKFIQQELYSHGKECLDEVLNMLTAEVLHDINALYMLILTVAYKGRQDEWEFERFRRIVGAIVCLQEPLSIDDLASLLDLRKSPSSTPVDIVHFVRRFRTILVTGTDTVDGSTIPRIHKSVYEFIIRNSIDLRFRVEPNGAHLELAIQCLAYMATIPILYKAHALSVPIRYASRFWSYHLSHVKHCNLAVLYADCRQSPTTPLSLLSRASHPSSPWLGSSMLTSKIAIHHADGIFIWDVTSGLSTTHMRPVSGVVMSPDCKEVVSWSTDRTIRVWDSTNAEFKRRLMNSSMVLSSVAISPGGKTVVSTSSDHMVRLWDYLSGVPIWGTSLGRGLPTSVLIFSNDGEWIILGLRDNTLRLLNARNGEIMGNPWGGHRSDILAVVFFSDNQRVCSVDDTSTCMIWDVHTGQVIKRCREHIYHKVSMGCASSPYDDNLVAIYGGSRIGILSLLHPEMLNIPNSRHTACLRFSPHREEIIFSTDDTISVATIDMDRQTSHIVRVGFTSSFPGLGHIRCFSPAWDFAYVISGHSILVHPLHHTNTSIKVLPTLGEPQLINQNKRIPDLSSAKEAKRDFNTTAGNQRLSAIKWYDLIDQAEIDNGLKLCVVNDTGIVAGYDNGSVAVWSSFL